MAPLTRVNHTCPAPHPAVQGVLLATSHHLFFQPAEAAGLPALFAASMRESYAALAALPLRLLGSAA